MLRKARLLDNLSHSAVWIIVRGFALSMLEGKTHVLANIKVIEQRCFALKNKPYLSFTCWNEEASTPPI